MIELLKMFLSRVLPLPRDGLRHEISKLRPVEDHADGGGGGHKNREDGFFCGPRDETVHQVGTRPLVALH